MIPLMTIFLTGLLTAQASEELKNLAKANNEFSINIYKSFPSTGNVFYCPASLFIALGMLFKGAGGKTAQEMREALSYKTAQLNDESVHQNSKELLDLFETASDKYTLQVANALVASNNYPISDEYKEDLKTYYNAITKEVNFKTEKNNALNEINSWVNEKTQGKIPQLLEDLDKDTVMVLLNAVYFKGTWDSQFNENLTKDDAFYADGIVAKPVRMMNKLDYFLYENFPEERFSALKLLYKGEDISMVILLPSEEDGLKDLEEALTLQKLTEVISSITDDRKVKVSIPKFKLEDSRELVENLKQLGIRDAFQEGSADFTGINKDGRMSVSDVVHKAVIEVNEEGSEAAGATAIIGVLRSSRPLKQLEFKADHPFLFFIRDERTEMILFMGRVNEL